MDPVTHLRLTKVQRIRLALWNLESGCLLGSQQKCELILQDRRALRYGEVLPPASSRDAALRCRHSSAHTTDSDTDSPNAVKRYKSQEQPEAEHHLVLRPQAVHPNQEYFEPIPRARRRKPNN